MLLLGCRGPTTPSLSVTPLIWGEQKEAGKHSLTTVAVFLIGPFEGELGPESELSGASGVTQNGYRTLGLWPDYNDTQCTRGGTRDPTAGDKHDIRQSLHGKKVYWEAGVGGKRKRQRDSDLPTPGKQQRAREWVELVS